MPNFSPGCQMVWPPIPDEHSCMHALSHSRTHTHRQVKCTQVYSLLNKHSCLWIGSSLKKKHLFVVMLFSIKDVFEATNCCHDRQNYLSSQHCIIGSYGPDRLDDPEVGARLTEDP